MTHQFFGFGAVIPEARDAEDYAANQFKKGHRFVIHK
jgi:hypothetical protein